MLRVQSKVLADKRLFCRFGMMTLLLNFIPLVGLLFSFTNTVGAALWAAQLEAQANTTGSGQNSVGTKKTA